MDAGSAALPAAGPILILLVARVARILRPRGRGRGEEFRGDPEALVVVPRATT